MATFSILFNVAVHCLGFSARLIMNLLIHGGTTATAETAIVISSANKMRSR